jgi:hypothetical protein
MQPHLACAAECFLAATKRACAPRLPLRTRRSGRGALLLPRGAAAHRRRRERSSSPGSRRARALLHPSKGVPEQRRRCSSLAATRPVNGVATARRGEQTPRPGFAVDEGRSLLRCSWRKGRAAVDRPRLLRFVVAIPSGRQDQAVEARRWRLRHLSGRAAHEVRWFLAGPPGATSAMPGWGRRRCCRRFVVGRCGSFSRRWIMPARRRSSPTRRRREPTATWRRSRSAVSLCLASLDDGQSSGRSRRLWRRAPT